MDPAAALTALGVTDATAITPVTGGWDTAIWRVESGGRVFALRVFREGQDEVCRREVAAMGAAAGGLPVPEVYAQGSHEGRPALLLSWLPGRPLVDEITAHPWRVWSLATAFGRMQARIHAVRAPATLRRKPERTPGDTADDTQTRSLADIRGPRDDALLHVDYHPLNVLTDGRRITGVLDWTGAAAGDPRWDLARTYSLLRLAPAPPGTPVFLVTMLRRVLEAGWRHGYRQGADPFAEMAPWYAAAATFLLDDLTPKLGRPGVWLEQRHLDSIRRAAETWTRRAGATS